MPLITADELRAYLVRDRVPADDTEYDEGRLQTFALTALIARVEALIEQRCDRRLVAPVVDETYLLDSDGRTMLRLPAWPVASLTSITNLVSGETVPLRETVHDYGYVVDAEAGRVTLIGYYADRGLQTVEVVGRLGYDPEAHPREWAVLQQAALEWCAYLWNASVPEAETMSFGEGSWTVRQEAIPRRVDGMLRPFRRPVI